LHREFGHLNAAPFPPSQISAAIRNQTSLVWQCEPRTSVGTHPAACLQSLQTILNLFSVKAEVIREFANCREWHTRSSHPPRGPWCAGIEERLDNLLVDLFFNLLLPLLLPVRPGRIAPLESVEKRSDTIAYAGTNPKGTPIRSQPQPYGSRGSELYGCDGASYSSGPWGRLDQPLWSGMRLTVRFFNP
jgi:hypothetical protein